MNYNSEKEQRYTQLTELRVEYPNIIFDVTKKERCAYAIAIVLEKGFVKVGFSFNPYRGFYVSIENDDKQEFVGNYYKTASEAFDKLSVWMHKHGYRFKRFETSNVLDVNDSSVVKEKI